MKKTIHLNGMSPLRAVNGLSNVIFIWFTLTEIQLIRTYQRSLVLAQTNKACLWSYYGNKPENSAGNLPVQPMTANMPAMHTNYGLVMVCKLQLTPCTADLFWPTLALKFNGTCLLNVTKTMKKAN